MIKKLKSYFTVQMLKRSLFAIGLGLLIASLIPQFANVSIALGVMAVGIFLETRRK